MKLIANRMRGMQDILPGEIEKWEYVERVMKEQADLYGFKLIRTPVVEYTDLFKRTTGEGSDIVMKEMYSFEDKGKRDVSLRPEGTAGVMRAVLENGLHNTGLPLKLMYLSPCYRYEKPQSGRYREFFQFGLETIGGNAAMADVEIMSVAQSIFDRLGLKNIRAHINAIGCEGCRDLYIETITRFFSEKKKFLCETCQKRFKRSPMRVFDCKNKKCQKLTRSAPLSVSYICKDCAQRFQRIKDYAYDAGIKVRVNPFLFRGLDYYVTTVFEFVDESDDERVVVCGGGRYDNLSRQFCRAQLTSVGLGIGVERLLGIMKKQNASFPESPVCDIYLAPLGKPARRESMKMAYQLRNIGIRAELDLVGRFIKAQMRYASKIKAKFTMVIGANEMIEMKAILKNMITGEEREMNLGENFVEEFKKILEKFNQS